MNHPQELSYFRRYRAAAVRFEIIGGALLAAAVLLTLLPGGSLLSLGLLLAAVGAFLLLIGGSSLRPHNLVKAFAQQCAREPGHEIAQGLLDAMQCAGRIRLVQRSIDSVDFAIQVYECLDDADPALIQQLRQAKQEHLARKAF